MGDVRNKIAKIERAIAEKRMMNRFLGRSLDYIAPPSPPRVYPPCGCGRTVYETKIVEDSRDRWHPAFYCSDCAPPDAIAICWPELEDAPVCNLYSMTSSQQAIRDLAKTVRDIIGNMPTLPAIFPDQMAPVVRTAADGQRELLMMRWGMAPPPQAKVKQVTNVRNPTSTWWRRWLAKPESRCLVPVTSFSEYDHRTTPPTCTWFAADESRALMFFAGIWQPWTGTRGTKAAPAEGEHLLFAFLTTEPNGVVAPVHPKAMPVLLLDEAARETWLTGPVDSALALQQPAPESAVRVVNRGPKQDLGGSAKPY